MRVSQNHNRKMGKCAVRISEEHEHIMVRAEEAAVMLKRLTPLKRISHVDWAVGNVLRATPHPSKPPNCEHINSFQRRESKLRMSSTPVVKYFPKVNLKGPQRPL